MRLLLAIMWLLHWLPLPILGRLGEGIGSLLYLYMRPRRHIALTNLRLCFPEKTEEERVSIAREHFRLFARSALERGILWWAPISRLRRLIQVEPGMPLDTFAKGPTILLAPHFVCLEIPGATLGVFSEYSACTIYTKQRNDVIDRALLKGRLRFRPATLLAREQGVKPIIRAMRKGLPFLMLPDMDFGIRDAEFVPFFGVPAATLTATARIAAATGAAVVPVVCTFLPDYKGWKATYYPAWTDYPGEDIVAATRRMNAFIEDRVREHPAEYFWAHKRFKTRPPGEPDVYGRDDA
ncbi:lipid A biosynthesis acyltransferase [Herbaspirillum seropedicae]|uniref:Lipid A biosynthesis lauroyl acyltransferase protein n=1 Tax=Herbaspirillum seropedicae (strain SmR1) TaxID=757424 RepID=D8IUM9_HERSS|nr:lipid A biosynthesis acyltransferase [Herbaspirillum seropedicae]ADJ65761.1 lipid A biosynthesis lauroyl acyltransferase protein [Herbaspirillum seropedicae SmR1]AKN67562.1 lipid A biosynthesis acyltransferase [Herbaspirillum seropedicae]NQE29606.1 lipid A biosynthesis acyltransferase [Herbaspirillum seropedicae]UMU23576.1 lipid A biosynthesis acyltransferase [Herbaspirillum seropedicae]